MEKYIKEIIEYVEALENSKKYTNAEAIMIAHAAALHEFSSKGIDRMEEVSRLGKNA